MGTERYRPSKALGRTAGFAHLVSNQTEKTPRIGMIGLDRENLPVDLLGGLQAAGSMVLDGNRQCLGNRCHDVNHENTTCQPQRVPRKPANALALHRGGEMQFIPVVRGSTGDHDATSTNSGDLAACAIWGARAIQEVYRFPIPVLSTCVRGGDREGLVVFYFLEMGFQIRWRLTILQLVTEA